jgi:ubiquinone/menaquinone biosynthesis C-methylase UbiE
MKDSTQRFTDRVEDYIKYRPSYPQEVIQALVQEAGLSTGKVIADIGSGTGILTRQLLETNCKVHAIEPNAAMRAAAEEMLGNHPGFISINATAENTSLPDRSLDGITAGQAFHWFDRLATKVEFRRVLRPGGFIALVWNSWQTDSSDFMKDYTKLLVEWGTDYQRVSRTNVDDAAIRQFFHPQTFQKFTFPHFQTFDYDGLRGRLFSSSYTPQEGHSNYEPLILGLHQLFDRHQHNNAIRFEYITTLYLG